MKRMKLSRISFLLMIFILLITACTPQVAPPPAEVDEAAEPTSEEAVQPAEPTTEEEAPASSTGCNFKDSPVLADQNLPSVCERVPVMPLVLDHSKIIPEGYISDPQIGSYGGPVVFTIGEGAIFAEPLFFSINRTPVPTGSTIFESMEPNEDYTAFTFVIRKGLRWSDGEPVTTEDVRFALEDVTMNDEIYPNVTNWLLTGGKGDGEPAKLDVVDDFTFSLTFAESFPTFVQYVSGNWTWYSPLLKPKHYLSQFHKDYADADALQQAVDESGFDQWYELFEYKDAGVPGEERSIGEPRLDPWLMSEYAEDRFVMKRNPYYGTVDQAGNQLPYIDEIIVYPVAFSAPETAELMMYSGEGHYNWNLDLTKLPLYKQEEAKGKMIALPYPNKDSRMMTLNFTYGPPDGEWRKIVGDVRFRQAIQLGIDKEEINTELYMNTAHMPTVQQAEYDVDEANRLLDEMGMSERDADGFRMTPEGEPFEIILTLMPEVGYSYQAPFIADYMKDIGINLTYKQVEASVYWEIIGANEHMGTIVWNFAPAFESNVSDPGFTPYNEWAPLWREWYYSGGEKGEEPPQWIKDGYAIYEEMSRTPYTSEEYRALEQRRTDWLMENIPFYTFVEQPGIVHMFSTCLGNVSGTEGAAGMPFHHGSWTQHRLIYMKPDCSTTN